MKNAWSFSILSTVLAYLAIAVVSLLGLAGLYLSISGKLELPQSATLPLFAGLALLALLPPVLFFAMWGRKLADVHAQAAHFISRVDNHAPVEEGFFPKVARCLKEAEDRLSADSAAIERRANELEQARASAFIDAMEKNTNSFAKVCAELEEKIEAATLTTDRKSQAIEDTLAKTEAHVAGLPDMLAQQLSDFDSRTQDSLAAFGQSTNDKLDDFQISYRETIDGFRASSDEHFGVFKGGYEASLDGFQSRYQQGLQSFDDHAAEKLADFDTRSGQALADIQAKIEKDGNEVRATIEANFRDLEALAGKGVYDLQTSLSAQSSKTDEEIKKLIADLDARGVELSAKIQHAMEDMLAERQRDLENLTERLDAEAGSLAEVTARLDTSTGRIDDISSKADTLDMSVLAESIEMLSNSGQTFTELKDKATGIFHDFAELCASEKQALVDLQQVSGENSELFLQHIAESKDSVLSGRKRIEQFVEEARGAIFQERRRIDHAMEAAVQQLEGRADSLTEMDKSAKNILSRLETSSANLGDGIQSAVDGAVSDTVSALREGTDKAVDHFTAALEDRGQDIKAHLSSIMEGQTKSTSELVQESSDQIREICSRAASLMDQQLENLEVQLIGLSGRVDTGVTSVAGKLSELFDKAERENATRLAESAQLVENTRSEIEERIQDIRDAGVSAMNFANMLRVAEEAVTAKTDLMVKSGQQFARIADDFEQRLPDLVSRAMDGIDGLAQDLAEKRPRLAGLIDQIDNDGRKIQQATERLAPLDMDKFRVDLGEVHDKLAVIARNMPQLGSDVAAAVFARLGSQITNFVNGYEGRLADLDNLMKAVPSSVEKILSDQTDHDEIKATLAELPAHMKDQLRDQLVELQQEEARSLNRLSDEFQGLSSIVEQLSGQVKGQLSAFQGSQTEAFGQLQQHLDAQVSEKLSAVQTGLEEALANHQPVDGHDSRAEVLGGFEDQLADIRKALKSMESSQLTSARFDEASHRRQGDLKRLEGLLNAQEERLKIALADMGKQASNGGQQASSLAPISEQALSDMQRELEALGSLTSELEKLRTDVASVNGQMVAQSEAVLAVPAAVDRLEGLENLYRTRDLLTGRKLGLHAGDIAFDQVSDLFNNIEIEAESTVRTLLEEASAGDVASRETLIRLLAHKENIDEWAGQLRNISTALALGQDAMGLAAQ